MEKIKFLKDTELKKKGDIVNCSKKSAELVIKKGYAEYIKEPRKKVIKRKLVVKKKIKNVKESLEILKTLIGKTLLEQEQEIELISEDSNITKTSLKETLRQFQKEHKEEIELQTKILNEYFLQEKLKKPARKEQAKWLSDKDTLDKHFSKWKRSDDGFLIKDNSEGCKIKNVSLKNSDMWVAEQNNIIREEKKVQEIESKILEWSCSWDKERIKTINEIKKFANKEFTYSDLKNIVELKVKEQKDKQKEIEEEKKKAEEEKEEESYEVMSRRGQIERFWKSHPFYYDSSKIFWLWDVENFKWKLSDEVDFCNKIFETLRVDTLDNKVRAEIIAGFKQVGRKHKPKPKKKSWVQYKDKIYDLETEEVFAASPKYFIMNPIPWSIGKSEDTPTIDKLFDDWMLGQDRSWKETLYEILAYNTCTDKFLQRLIALVGGGSNGKGTYMKLTQKFLGEENCVASEIKQLSENHFEPAVLFGKLLCVMGEVSYDDLKNTNQLKKLGGEDKISFQFKGKTPFTEDNTATCMCLTNSMPITPDKTQGFYRKWLIIDFLNQFKEIDIGLINKIPDVEFNNLAKKCLRILKELYKNPHLTNEGDFLEREKRYEERSNPIMKFVDEKCIELENEMTSLRDFTNHCNDYLRERHLRVLNSKQIGRVLRDEGFIVGPRNFMNVSTRVIINLKIKKPNTITT